MTACRHCDHDQDSHSLWGCITRPDGSTHGPMCECMEPFGGDPRRLDQWRDAS
jgi:hypothetical protein